MDNTGAFFMFIFSPLVIVLSIGCWVYFIDNLLFQFNELLNACLSFPVAIILSMSGLSMFIIPIMVWTGNW